MTLRNYILFILLVTFLYSCFDSTQRKKYSITTYFESFDSAHVSLKNLGKKFKYTYEEYNSDSNLILQNQYATNNEDEWGKLIEKTKTFYNGKQKIKAKIEGGTPYEKSDDWRDRYKEIDTYEYAGEELTKWLRDGKLHEEYKYNGQKKMIEKRADFFNSDSSKFSIVRYTYSNGLKVRAKYIPIDTIYGGIDTFIYKNNKLVEKNSYGVNGKMIEHRVIIRNQKGQAIEEKWKNPFLDWRKNEDGKWVNAEFNQMNKYFYDNEGRLLRTEYYRADEYYRSYQLFTIYEFKYN